MSIIYLDTSALLKLYVQEKHSAEVLTLVSASAGIGTSILAYTEVAAGLKRAERMRLLSEDAARFAWERFLGDWPDYVRLNLSSALIERAASLAWDLGLRGYDAVHLAAALTWQDALGEPVFLATFDRSLWQAGAKAGVGTWPEALKQG
jgi:predicted nucleic acid-binding protein